jgi:DNA-binding transcriptional ArsR family regulator
MNLIRTLSLRSGLFAQSIDCVRANGGWKRIGAVDTSDPQDNRTPAPLLHALNHSARRQILRSMSPLEAASPTSPVEAAASLDMPLTTVSYHFRVLAATGAVDEVDRRPVRGTIQHFYEPSESLRAAPWVPDVLADTAASD